MRYLGGKGRIAKQLSEIMLDHAAQRNGQYWEPFVGGGAMAAAMGQHFHTAHYSDIHEDLIMMWDALNAGWVPPENVSLEQYRELRAATQPSALRGFVGFGGSFGGKWFAGYARGGHNSNGTPRNHQAESQRAVLRDIEKMRARTLTTFSVRDVFSITPGAGDLVYCDPPYSGTTKYSSTDSFDHERFWNAAKQWASAGAHVYVSEYQAPPGWTSIWEKPLRSSVRIGSEDRHIAIEKLFTWAGSDV